VLVLRPGRPDKLQVAAKAAYQEVVEQMVKVFQDHLNGSQARDCAGEERRRPGFRCVLTTLVTGACRSPAYLNRLLSPDSDWIKDIRGPSRAVAQSPCAIGGHVLRGVDGTPSGRPR
jgi:hypothetical protein